MTDPRNCGRCGNVCEFGVCEEGVCFQPCKTLQSGINHCVFTADLAEEFPCYVDDDYGQLGGSTCSSDADCQASCPKDFDCVCSQYWASSKAGVGYRSTPSQCIAINKPVAGKCCYPTAEQTGNGSLWYCFIDENGVEHLDSAGSIEVKDANSDDLTCETTADCLLDDDCQSLQTDEYCVCAQGVNEGNGEIDGSVIGLSPKICYKGNSAG